LSIANGLDISKRDWRLLEELRNCLKPFELATKIMSSENLPTTSIIQPLIYEVRGYYLKLNFGDSNSLREFLINSQKRFSNNNRYDI